MNNSHRYCYANFPPIFVGFSSSTSPNEAFHSILKRLQPLEKDYSVAIKNCLICVSDINSKQKQVVFEGNPLEEYFLLPELRIARILLAKPVFTELTKELALSLRL